LFRITTSPVDDRKVLNTAIAKIKNTVFVADGGYISKKYQSKAYQNNNFIITTCKSNMKILSTLYQNKLMNMRSRIESVFSTLKNHYQLTSTLSRSVNG
jgi:Transposase DDE domain